MEETPSFDINNFHTDYKAAVLAAELVEAGFDINRLFIWPSGSARRNFSKDVLSVEWYAPDGGYKDYLCIKSSREGLYDMLPEGLFHASVPYSSTRTTEELIDQIKLHKEQEKQARKFFLPLEAEINMFRVLIELHENKIDKKNIYNDLVEIFRPGWEIFELLDQQQANIFLHLIPLLHQAKGDLARLEQVAGLMLGWPVRVATGMAGVYCSGGDENGLRGFVEKDMMNYVEKSLSGFTEKNPQSYVERSSGGFVEKNLSGFYVERKVNGHTFYGSILGESKLGIDLVAGNTFLEGDEEVTITIGPVSAADALKLMPGERLAQVMKWLVGYFVPGDVSTRMSVEIADKKMKLEESILGYTAFI